MRLWLIQAIQVDLRIMLIFLDGYSEYHDSDASSFRGIETPDNYTVVFHLNKPRIDAVSTLGTQKICSSEYLNYKKGKQRVSKRKIVSQLEQVRMC